ncbi:murein L,D-transpeptidase [Algimonas arctica]|uniref:Murein L,D-transpeptidase n=1 Tax=Algimonas arctica TaxID=1479486 RepID=A0A8J3CTX8_9PROT|nr:L,D-transpeptidase family protein [Algimonas arctica]GHB02803.1 murein L,D-transpeptidase [Algimonas arctica]
MTTSNQINKPAPRKSSLKIVAVSAIAMTTALMSFASVTAQVHAPVKRVDGPAVTVPELLGEPKGSDIALALEASIVDDQIDETFGNKVSPGAKSAARQAYAQGVFAPLWTRKAAERLMQANPTCKENGLDSGYTDAQLREAIDNRFSGTAEQRALADLRLTETWLVLASKMSGGLSDEGGMVSSTDDRPTRSDLIVALSKASQTDPIKSMEEYASMAPQYGELKTALKRYRQHADNGGWMRIREGDEMLEPGMDDPRVPALRKRLAAEGYIDPTPFRWLFASLRIDLVEEPTVYGEMLAQQVKSFQAAYGLEQDGVLGPATMAALNESVESKIDRIERAMDYWRENANPGERYIWVNIPSYRAEAWTGDRRDVSMKTIVGKSRTPSNAFSDEIEYIVVNPKWFLPVSLFKRQKLHKLQNDPGYAARNKYDIYDRSTGAKVDPYTIDWSEPGVANQIQMVQSAGPHNALGQLKIIFPNKHSIYLHDTPDHSLFDLDVRALSSGCIRLDDPVAMANWLTDGDTSVSTTVFNATLASGERERFYLDQHVNVHLTYLPAVVSPEGQVEFPADIYQEFKKPTLAQETYPDNSEPIEDNERYVDMNDNNGPRTKVLH